MSVCVLSLFFSSFFFTHHTHILIHTHIHTPSLMNRLSETKDSEAGSSATSLIIHTLTHTHTLKGDVHG